MQVKQVLAAVATADPERSEAFYTQLLGTGPSDRPMDGLLEWRLGGAGVLQVVTDAARAGGSLLTLQVDAVPDAEGEVSTGGEFRTLTDPDGNGVTLVAG